MPNEAPPANNLPLPHAHCVLLVDESDDTRDVIRTVLERRGVTILETPSPDQGLALLRNHHPDVVVLDLETDSSDPATVQAAYDSELEQSPAELVILGNLRHVQATGDRHIVRKPYHYGPLIQMIESLIGQSSAAAPS